MRLVFIDTSAWVALKHKGDSLWKQATDLNRSLLTGGVRYITSNFVLDETYTLLRLRAGHHIAVELGEEIANSHLVTVVRVAEPLETEAWQIFKRYADKEFSFTDCTSFAIMRQQNIGEAFTNDHHFEQFGYQILLK
jgi:predicted nucleic acid-binding protein